MIRRLLGITFVLGVAAAAQATTMVPLDVKMLTERADRVVHAVVETSESRWSDQHDVIFTDVTLRVLESYKGGTQSGEAIVVRREGGTAGGIGMRVFGAASFTVGEEVVAFVQRRGATNFVVGMAQGKLRVVTLADGTKRVNAPNLSGIALLPGQKATPITARPLDDLAREVRSYVRSVQ